MYPCAYLTGLDINFAKIIETVVRSIIHSAVVFVFPILAYRALEHNDNGSVFVVGTLVRASFHAEHLHAVGCAMCVCAWGLMQCMHWDGTTWDEYSVVCVQEYIALILVISVRASYITETWCAIEFVVLLVGELTAFEAC